MGYDMEMDDFHEDQEHKEKELDKLLKDVLKEAKAVIEDYANNPSEVSGSVIQIHQDSPFLDKDKK